MDNFIIEKERELRKNLDDYEIAVRTFGDLLVAFIKQYYDENDDNGSQNGSQP